MNQGKREVIAILLVTAGIGLLAVSFIDWITYQSFLLSLVWL